MQKAKAKKEIIYSEKEEYFNSMTHFLGAGIFITGLVLLIYKGYSIGSVTYIVTSSIYCATAIFLYLMSGTYHYVKNKDLKKFFKALDHSAIYLLIAGSYTPYIFNNIDNPVLKWSLFGGQWGLAIVGVSIKLLRVKIPLIFNVLIYLLMGWMAFFVLEEFKNKLPPISLTILINSGVVYSLGTIFYAMKKIPYTHTIWHLFVLGGSILGFLSIYFSV